MQDGAYMVVGRYSGVSGTILGNMAGRYADNVLPLRGPNYKPKVGYRVSHDFLYYQDCNSIVQQMKNRSWK